MAQQYNRENQDKVWLELGDLVDLKQWQNIQDSFSSVVGISLRTLDAQGAPLTGPSSELKLCCDFLKDFNNKKSLADLCLPTFLGGKSLVNRNLSYSCLPGLENYIVPLRLETGRLIAYIIAGPLILVARKQKEEYRELVDNLGIDLDKFWDMLLEIKVLSFQGAQSLVELIRDIGQFSIDLAYRSLIKEHKVIDGGIKRLKRLLDILLDVAFEVSGAETGSIMFLDKEKDHLTINASRGIPEEFIKNKKIKLGDGISGIAAKEGEAFLINEHSSDNRIRPYLKRPQLGSSMVIPMKAQDEVLGVMNLGSLKDSGINFDSANLIKVNSLLEIASAAIQSTFRD